MANEPENKGRTDLEGAAITLFESEAGEACIGLPEPANLIRLSPDEADDMARNLMAIAASIRTRAPTRPN